MRTLLRWALRVAALVALLLILTLTAGMIRPELFDYLPEPVLAVFRASPLSDLQMYSVSGTVTFDGEPVAEGEIRFVPMSKNLNPDVGKIRKGKFVAQIKEGEHKVEIRALKGETQFIPARYNIDTDLRFQAKDGEQNFELRSDGK